MKQYKRSLLVFIGLAFATLLAVINYKGQTKTQMMDPAVSIADQMPAAPAEGSTASQQMAVETQPVGPVPSHVLPQQVDLSQVEGLTMQEMTLADTASQNRPLSFIGFLSLAENYDIQGHQIDWRAYREYRRTFARSLQNQ